ncbi:MAG TPA: OmpH family outer membrane protein [Candidatus Sulfopaludibacter sp.]|nr:OmpH family outer membrane protein [Candidatus Sulfopaludibacter sp.]
MRNVLRIILPTVLLTVFLSSPALAQQKIATVDLRKLFDGYWKTKQAETALNDRKAELDKEDRGFLDNLQKDRETYQKLLDAAADQAISSDERDKRKQAAADKYAEIKDSQTAIVQFERQAQATLGAQTQRMRSDIIKEITAAVSARAKAAGYTMVVDTASDNANQTSVVVYNDGQNDLTAAVLAQLNAGAPIDMNKTDASAVPALTITTNSP